MFSNRIMAALRVVVASASVVAFFAQAQSPRPAVLDRTALPITHPEHAYLLGAALAGNRWVSVGENGLVIFSDDQGNTWRQGQVPVSVLLTAVVFADAKEGWAIGHLGVVLHTADGGETWTRQLDGVQAADLVLQDAKERLAKAPDEATQKALLQAQNLVADGPDKPFLSLAIEGPGRLLVLGAFGAAFRSEDGGQHWRVAGQEFANPTGLHYYGVSRNDNSTMAVGEQGLALRSLGEGNFKSVGQPYEGTLFGVQALHEGAYVAYGLRGNIVRSLDQGQTWTLSTSHVSASIQAGTVLEDGTLILAAESGQLISSQDAGKTFTLLEQRVQPAAAIVPVSARNILVVGPQGVQVVSLGKRTES